ncbi:transglycosylase SLT domain-containing protein [Streptomyces sp. NPDC051658]|uniref:transglycosylase SLT domain-containing protein n=1 Tax=unclassified Streptomyces TaxID=2593676 RepID=UPI0037B0C525|nr:transglycosylase SLT domain-containing protein [Streptomyces sp. NBC_00984]
MSVSSILGRRRRLNKTQKLSVAGISAMAAAALSFSLVPANADPKPEAESPVSAAPVVFASVAGTPQAKAVQASIIEQHSTAEKLVKAADLARAKKAAAAKAKAAEVEAQAKAKAEAKARAAAKVKAEAVAAKRSETQAASRSEARTPVYANNLDGWINQALDIMRAHGIPGSYNGLHRNIMRESTGNPNAVNGWDINAQNGTPSCGLLQVIQPTFSAYHVPGTSSNIYDPVANITAAANYAADKYGSIDNVNSAY